MNAATLRLMAHSMGLPKPLIALVEKIAGMGFGGFVFAPLPADSPLWLHVKPEAPELPSKHAFAARVTNETGRLTAVIFYEGKDDEAIRSLMPDAAAIRSLGPRTDQ